MSNSRQPDPLYAPPTPTEIALGYAFSCPHCERQWPVRLRDSRTRRCVPCAREWRRDDMASRRRGLGGVPLTKNPVAHPFESSALRRTVDLNSAEARKQIVENPRFAAEVADYLDRLIAKNSTPAPPLRGIVPLLPRSRAREAAQQTDLPDEPRGPFEKEAADLIATAVDERMSEIDGEVVD